MKKFTLVLVFIMLLSCISFAHAEEEPTVYTSGDFAYFELDDGTVEIGVYNGEDKELNIPSALDGYAVTSIGDYAFFSCGSLTEINIPDSVTSIGDYAFNRCLSLTEITIPNSVTSIGANPFGYCAKLSKIVVSPKHPTLATIDGVLFDKTEKKLVLYPFALAAETYEIPKGIVSIDEYAFSGNFFLTEITIPDSVTSIGAEAFAYCKSLIEITIPDSVTSIGDRAFCMCDSINEITIPDSVTSIGDFAFVGCDSLIVDRDSYAEKYAEEHDIPYTYPDANDWLYS